MVITPIHSAAFFPPSLMLTWYCCYCCCFLLLLLDRQMVHHHPAGVPRAPSLQLGNWLTTLACCLWYYSYQKCCRTPNMHARAGLITWTCCCGCCLPYCMLYAVAAVQDSDTLVLRNIDHILRQYSNASFAASPECFPPDTFNSGVMVRPYA